MDKFKIRGIRNDGVEAFLFVGDEYDFPSWIKDDSSGTIFFSLSDAKELGNIVMQSFNDKEGAYFNEFITKNSIEIVKKTFISVEKISLISNEDKLKKIKAKLSEEDLVFLKDNL